MRLTRVTVAPLFLLFWRFVAKVGGPGHPSYIHARWRIWQEQALLSSFLENGE